MSSIQLKPNCDKFEGDSEVQYVAHRLPCTVHFDGPLPTARAFCPFPEPMEHFRGRKLGNDTFNLPSSSQLVMVEKKKKKIGDGQEAFAETLEIKRILHPSIIHYEQDNPPAENSPFPSALRWLSLSEALHAPVDPEELKSFADGNEKDDLLDTEATSQKRETGNGKREES